MPVDHTCIYLYRCVKESSWFSAWPWEYCAEKPDLQMTLVCVEESGWPSFDLDVCWVIKLTLCAWESGWPSDDFDVRGGIKLTFNWPSCVYWGIKLTFIEPDLEVRVQESNQHSAWPWYGLKNQADLQLDLNLCHFQSETRSGADRHVLSPKRLKTYNFSRIFFPISCKRERQRQRDLIFNTQLTTELISGQNQTFSIQAKIWTHHQ